MKLQDLITAVKEQSLTREQLEGYRDQMSHLFADMQIEMAELEKEEALFMGGRYLNNLSPQRNELPSVAERKVMWKGTKEGQRLITLKRYALATKELLNSLKSRIYQHIY